MDQFNNISAIGVDFGATKILAGRVTNGSIKSDNRNLVPRFGTEEQVMEALYKAIDPIFDESISGIGVGVPSVVNIEEGIVYDVQNIPSWKEVRLKDLLEVRYNVPVYINNDANCFAIGEKYFGEGSNYKNVVALIVGTGMAAGIIINDQLYNGYNCGAGEFGMIPYLDKHYEYYCSGQFFNTVHNTTGEDLYRKAQESDNVALAIFREFGNHLGIAINTILYAYDPEVIILGGSVSRAYQYFEKSLWAQIKTLVYKPVVERISIKTSTNPDIAVLGAAALYFDNIKNSSH